LKPDDQNRLGIPPGGFSLRTNDMESFRQALGAVYVALATAAGDDVLAEANIYLQDSLNAGGIDDPYARSVIEQLIRVTSAHV
jgi:hypothetical protein